MNDQPWRQTFAESTSPSFLDLLGQAAQLGSTISGFKP